MKESLLVSACLVGRNTKYNGGNNLTPEMERLKEKYHLVLICPEVMGGLSVPRNPSEIQNGKVYDCENRDVTDFFAAGAEKTLELIKKYHITKAVLKDGSPSCGSRQVYDGSFSGVKIPGQGITARRLRENNVEIFTEKELYRL